VVGAVWAAGRPGDAAALAARHHKVL